MKAASRNVHHQIKLLVVGLILGSFAILIASAFRDLFDSMLQMAIPVSERVLGTGGYLFLWRLAFFLIILSLFIIASILLS